MRDRPYEFQALATYNAEVARGLMHTEEWKRRMAGEQERFNAARDARMRADAYEELGGGFWMHSEPVSRPWWKRAKK